MYIKVNNKIMTALSHSTSLKPAEDDEKISELWVGDITAGVMYTKYSCSTKYQEKSAPKSISTNAYKLAIILISKFTSALSWKGEEIKERTDLSLFCDEWSQLTGIKNKKAWETLVDAASELSCLGFVDNYIQNNNNIDIISFLHSTYLPSRKKPLIATFSKICSEALLNAPAINIPACVLKTSGKSPSAVRLAVGLGIRWANRITHKSYQYQSTAWAQMKFKYALEVAGISDEDFNIIRKFFSSLKLCEINYFFVQNGLILNDEQVKKIGLTRAMEEVRLVFQFREEVQDEQTKQLTR